MNYADNALEFRSGNPKPQGTPDDILAAGRKFYHELSGETAEFIDFMYDNELLDVLSRKGKAGGGYCTTLGSYNCPFIFANFNGTFPRCRGHHARGGPRLRELPPAASSSPASASGRLWRPARCTPCPWSSSPGPGPSTSSARTPEVPLHASVRCADLYPYGTMVDHFSTSYMRS